MKTCPASYGLRAYKTDKPDVVFLVGRLEDWRHFLNAAIIELPGVKVEPTGSLIRVKLDAIEYRHYSSLAEALDSGPSVTLTAGIRQYTGGAVPSPVPPAPDLVTFEAGNANDYHTPAKRFTAPRTTPKAELVKQAIAVSGLKPGQRLFLRTFASDQKAAVGYFGETFDVPFPETPNQEYIFSYSYRPEDHVIGIDRIWSASFLAPSGASPAILKQLGGEAYRKKTGMRMDETNTSYYTVFRTADKTVVVSPFQWSDYVKSR